VLTGATSEREKISFHQINKNTGHRIKYRKVDAESGDEVESEDIIKGYEVGKGEYIELGFRPSQGARSRSHLLDDLPADSVRQADIASNVLDACNAPDHIHGGAAITHENLARAGHHESKAARLGPGRPDSDHHAIPDAHHVVAKSPIALRCSEAYRSLLLRSVMYSTKRSIAR
jgi:Ku70/Ku80 beta-barrel domain